MNIRSMGKTLFSAVVLSLLTVSGVWAAEDAGEPPSLNDLSPYPNAQLVEEKQQEEARNYPVFRNRVSKIRGRIRSTDGQWLNGTLSRRIYEIPRGHSSDEAFAFFGDALAELDAKPLFNCSGRDCGPSHLWANDIFRVAFLYGYDSDQRYRLLQRGDGDEYFALYTITRGNRRTYALIDHLVVDKAL